MYFIFSVIVFAVPWHALRMYLLIAHELGMARGDFAFICVHGDVSISKVIGIIEKYFLNYLQRLLELYGNNFE